jgi:glutamate synthase (NADPH/NADH) small chain
MSQEQASPDIAAHRLSEQAYEANFADLHPPLDPHEARVAADRCLFCWEAPCVAACPTGIDIPLFIRQISTGNALAAAKTILDANIMGGMCARVCPTETLCEQACVREAAEGAPVRIGLLQRHATDALLASGRKPYRQGAPTGPARRRGRERDRQALPAPTSSRRSATRSRCSRRAPSRPGSTNMASRLQDAGRFRRARGRLHPRCRRHRAEDRGRARPRRHARFAAGRAMMRSSSDRASAPSTRSGSRPEALAGVEDAVGFIARLRPGRPIRATSRSAGASS